MPLSLRSANPENFRTPRRFHADSAPLRLGGLCVLNAFLVAAKGRAAARCIHPPPDPTGVSWLMKSAGVMAGTGAPAKSPTFRVTINAETVVFATIATAASSKSARESCLASCHPAASRLPIWNGARPDPSLPRRLVWMRVCARDSKALSNRAPDKRQPKFPPRPCSTPARTPRNAARASERRPAAR